jgi:hypothetical protein
MRAVSFFRPGGSELGVRLSDAGGGAGVGGEIGGETGGGGGGDGNSSGGVAFSGTFGATEGSIGGRKGSLSRDPVSSPGGVTRRDGKAMRTVSFLGSFGSGIRGIDWFQNIARKWPACHSLSSLRGKIWFRRSAKPSSQKIVSSASGNSAPNEFAHRRRLG